MRGAFLLLSSGIASLTAEAGPWGQQKENVFARAAVSGETIDGATAWRADLYGEYGLSKKWTLIAKAESVHFSDADDFNANEAKIVAQRRVYNRRNIVAAIGGGPVYGAAIGGISDCDTIGVEARSSVGTSGNLAGREWYGSVDVSGRWHSDGCQRQKIDFVFGVKYNERTTFSPQLYLEQSNRGADSAAVQIEYINHFAQFDLTYGYKFESGGLFEQHAAIVAISKRF